MQSVKIQGYRELNEEEIELLNQIKEAEKELMSLVKRVRVWNTTCAPAADSPEHYAANESHRWISIAKTHFEQGYMALCRAVAKPELNDG